jgi:tRNA (adenine37-N6)-methyltransferase
MTTFQLEPVGHVASPVVEPTDLDWGKVVSRVIIRPDLQAGLQGLEAYSHVIIVTLLHRAAFDRGRHLIRRPRGLAWMPLVGIFAQRAKDRPNPLGITVVRLLEVTAEAIVVQGLDAIDGTPVLDIKPYYPQYDAVESPTVPEWVNELMKGYF